MTAHDDIRREYLKRHRGGQHSWQPGPLVKRFEKPDSILLVCACGELLRKDVPVAPQPSVPPADPLTELTQLARLHGLDVSVSRVPILDDLRQAIEGNKAPAGHTPATDWISLPVLFRLLQENEATPPAESRDRATPSGEADE